MGGIIQSIFGSKGSKQTSESKNLAYPFISDTYSPQATGGVNAFNTLGSALGVGGDFGGQQQAYDNYLNNTGYGYALKNAEQGLTNSNAGRFFLRSGATAKGLQDRFTNIGQTYFNNYLDRLGQMSQLGLGAGGLISGAGQTSKGSGTSGGDSGIGNLIGTALSIFAASDRRLKKNIEYVGLMEDGIPIYRYEYKSGFGLPEGRQLGVMADDVEKVRPWALGPEINGFKSVNYGELGA